MSARIRQKRLGAAPRRDGHGPAAASSRRRLPPTIRFRLLVTVNAAMAVLVIAFLILDYRRELTDRLAQKRVALEEEAKTILPAVLRLSRQGPAAVQEFLNAVCGRMRDAQSPQHHIAVRLGDTTIQATAHGRSSPELFRAMEAASRAPRRRAALRDAELVVGSARTPDVVAYVSEDLGVVRRAVLGRSLWRLGGIVALGAVAAAVASAVLLRIVDRPLRRLVDTVGQIAAGNFAARARPFQSAELMSLSEAINGMAASLDETERQRRNEMAKARRIQQHLLPRVAEVPGLELAAVYRPANEVAGDYYDVLRLRDGTWLLCIADVAGHGVPAALSAAMLKGFLLHAVEHHVAPDKLLGFINRRFADASPAGLFASMLLVRWHPDIGSLSYASAGHEPGWHLSADGAARPLEATGLFLGVDPDVTWSARTLPVAPGDRLLLTTDGAAETFNSQQELFGRDRLRRLLVHGRDTLLEDLLGAVDRELTTHREGAAPADDTTIVAVEFVAPGQPPTGHSSPVRLALCHSR